MSPLDHLLNWLDRKMADAWPAYTFLIGLVLFGCCCGGSCVALVAWVIS